MKLSTQAARLEAAAQKWRREPYVLLHSTANEYDIAQFYRCRELARTWRKLKCHSAARTYAAQCRKHLTAYSQRKAAAELGINLEKQP